MMKRFSYFLLGLVLLAAASGVHAAESAKLTSETLAAKVGGRDIHYGEIRMDEKTLTHLKSMGLPAEQLEQYRHQVENARLMKIIQAETLKDFPAENTFKVSDEELNARVAQMNKKMFGKEKFSQADADRMNARINGMVRLLETWQKDPKAGEALYKKEFSNQIPAEQWEGMKKDYANPQQLAMLKAHFKTITPESELESFKKQALPELQHEKYIQSLIKAGQFKDPKEYDDWLAKRMHDKTTYINHDIIGGPNPHAAMRPGMGASPHGAMGASPHGSNPGMAAPAMGAHPSMGMHPPVKK
jgi:hypothetical protein